MKILLVYYSRTGTTKKLAEALAWELGADLEELIDKKDRRGAWGYLISGRDAMAKRLTEIESPKKDPATYDLVILGTPVWGAHPCPALRTYLSQKKKSLKKIALFATQGSSGAKKTFRLLEELCELKAVATLALSTKQVWKENYKEAAGDFLGRIKAL